MSYRLVQGTKEILPVDVSDLTLVVTSLAAATSVQFDVLDDANIAFYSNQPATTTGMRINCLVDTSAAHPSGLWPVGHYRIFPEFTIGTESVRGLLDIYLVAT